MTSVRLDSALKEALVQAAAAAGQTPSEFIREAIRERVAHVRGATAREALQSFIGLVASESGSHARDSGAAFTALLTQRRA